MKAIQRTPICLCQSFTLTFWGHRVPVFPSPLRCLLVFVLDSSTSSFYVSFLFSFYTVLAFLSLTLSLVFILSVEIFLYGLLLYLLYGRQEKVPRKTRSRPEISKMRIHRARRSVYWMSTFSSQCSIFNWTWLLAGFTLLRFVYFLLINLSVPLTDQFINTNSNRVEGKNRMNFISEIFWFIRIPFLFVGISS